MAAIGIDFGNSFTTIAWISPLTGKPQAVDIHMPSLMLCCGNSFLVGQEAVDAVVAAATLPTAQRLAYMANAIPHLKTIIDPAATEYLGGRDYSHLELLTTFFKQLFKKVKDVCGEDYAVDHVVLTHPALMSHPKVELMLDALHTLGYENTDTMTEPVAAVKGYALTHAIGEGQGFLVFDYGSIQADAAFVKILYGQPKVATEPCTATVCGGRDLDYMLYEHLRSQMMQNSQIDISSECIDMTVMDCCRKLKECFCHETGDICEVEIPRIGSCRMSREAFHTIIGTKVDEAMVTARRVAADVKSRGYTVDKILLVGGSARLPIVRERLSVIFPNISMDYAAADDSAVATGAISEDAYEPQDDLLDRNISITCRNPQCRSKHCYRYKKPVRDRGFLYRCLECGWEGNGVNVVFR